MSKQADAFLNLIKAIEKFVMVMAEEEADPIWDCKECDENFNNLALLVSLLVSYHGGEFCQGVLIAFKGRAALMKFFALMHPGSGGDAKPE